MNTQNTEPFVPMRDFWSDYLSVLVGVQPPARDPDVINHYLDQLFGGLTTHAFGQLQVLPIVAECHKCRNNLDQRRDSVCQTHIGALRGTLQAVTGVPLTANFDPRKDGECRIALQLATADDGRPLVATVRRMPHVYLDRAPSGQARITDLRNNAATEVNDQTARLLFAADEVSSIETLASEVDIDLQAAAIILDHCYQLGWVECSFQPRAT